MTLSNLPPETPPPSATTPTTYRTPSNRLLSTCTATYGRRMCTRSTRCTRHRSRASARGFLRILRGLPSMPWRLTLITIMCFACCIVRCGSGICMRGFRLRPSSGLIRGIIIVVSSRLELLSHFNSILRA